MTRRRSTPWIYQYSRPLIAAVAGLGMLNTGYLTLSKFLNQDVVCPTSGCHEVLSSTYATLFGLPLALFGLGAYTAMAAMALGPLVLGPQRGKAWGGLTWNLLFAGALAMTVFSGYLMFIMVTKFVAPYGWGGLCVFCIASAASALTMLVLTLVGREWEDWGHLLFVGTLVGTVVLVGSVGVYAPPAQVSSTTPGFVITTNSGPAEMGLAQHLRSIGAKMYGAYWCPHCHDQKQLFGKQAFALIHYIECDPQGPHPQPALCQAAHITGYPTWEIQGKFVSGVQTLESLAQMSGYRGPQNFQNSPSP